MTGGRLNHERAVTCLFLASVFLLALTKVQDTDAWMHLSFGRLIWELGGLPEKEPFIYPSLDRPFSYSSWLFGLLYYAAYRVFDLYGPVLLKALTVTAAFSILLKDSLLPGRNMVVSALTMTVVVIMARHRFVLRPDTFLMLFLSFSIYALNAYLYEGRRYLYALPLVHLLWANSHSSINLMFVPFLSFIVGGLIQIQLERRGLVFSRTPTPSRLKRVGVLFIASFAASLVSPYFLDQYTFGAQFLASDWWRQEIIELASPTWQTTKWPFVTAAALGLSFLLNRRQPSLIHLLLVVPFAVLAFTALRFVFLFGIVSGPVLARNVSLSLRDSGVLRRLLSGRAATAVVSVWILGYSALTLLAVEPFGNRPMAFGFGFDYTFVPEGALSYMDRRGITGRVFNLFQWGGYITWRDYPERTAFVDGRGYLPVGLLERQNLARRRPLVLDELHETYGFESILVEYPIDDAGVSGIPYDTDLSLSHEGWALVYWDDVALLYLRRGGPYEGVIREDEYRFIKPANRIAAVRARLRDPGFREGLIAELKRNIKETGSSKAHAFLGFVYNEIGLYREAIEVLSKVRDVRPVGHLADAYSGIAYAYGNLGDLEKAVSYYRRSLQEEKNATTLYNLGIAFLKMGEKREAARYLSRAVELNRNLISAYPQLIGIYRSLGMAEEAERTERMYSAAKAGSRGEEHFKKALKAYFEKRYDVAAREYRRSIEVNPANPAPYSNLGYIYFDMGMMDRAYEYQRMALDIDPDFANAHYGLALIYRKAGDREMAVKHFKEYIRVEPRGYYTRRAKEAIEALR